MEQENMFTSICKNVMTYILIYKNLINLIILLYIFESYRYLIPIHDLQIISPYYIYHLLFYKLCKYYIIRKFIIDIQSTLIYPIEKHICTAFASYMTLTMAFCLNDALHALIGLY